MLEAGRLDLAELSDIPRADWTPHRYVGICGAYLTVAVELLGEAMRGSPNLAPAIGALMKAVMRELALTIEATVSDGFVPRQTAAELARTVTAAADALRRERAVGRSRDEFVSMLVHDLRNPVQGIALQANVALQIAIKSLDAERDHLSQIERTCQDLSRLLQDMLETAKLEAGQMPVVFEPLVLGEFLNGVLDRHLPLIERAGMRLTRGLNADVPPIRTDADLLGRVLMNLIVNAVRHSGTEEIRVEIAPETKGATARIIDYGHGIPAPDQERIFEKFASGSVPFAGQTGLGLYFCRLATERMDGHLRLTSRPGLTIFELDLPSA
ncbi:MAG TPA: HAMP domain-containing sensor histidine kinase [Candidatus Binatus sp.]|nr:HAMP domain-containing sensor histidine kinase [Candidatus Binatus sp.]